MAHGGDPVGLARAVTRRALELGFALAGVCPARPSDHESELRQWLAEGRHGGMTWLAERVEERCDPARVLPGARSILMVADQYASRADAGTGDTAEATGVGRDGLPLGKIARYARGDDYHVVMKRRLHALADALRAEHSGSQWRAFVDTAPVLEREHAARAGLGWIGRHTLLINPRRGSYLLLGGLLTTVELHAPPEQEQVHDHCGTCTRCIDACPTQAITDRSVDARRCISFLTIERREPIDPAFIGSLSGWLFGCDICQEVCPHNSARAPGDEGAGEAHPAYAPRRSTLPLLDVLGWTAEDRARALKGSAMKRATLAMLKRNAALLLAEHHTRDRLS